MTARAFAAWAAQLGLGKLTPEDLHALQRGWMGLYAQREMLREGLTSDDRPPRPPLGAA